MPPLRSRPQGWLLRLLTRRRGPARGLHDLRAVTEVLRFSAVFTALILAPVILLASLALRSLEAEVVAADADLQRRAERIAVETHAHLEETFQNFIDQVRLDLQRGGLTTSLQDVAGLRGAYRFDPQGQLTGNLRFADLSSTTSESAAWASARRRARRAEDDGRWRDALEHLDRAYKLSNDDDQQATVAYERARVSVAASRPEAPARLIQLADRFPEARHPDGFRIANLATLLRARLAAEADREEEATALYRGLVERALAGVWEIGTPNQGVLAEIALEALEGKLPPRWLRAADLQLTRRMDLAYWAHHVADELRLLSTRAFPIDTFVFRAEERSLWVVHARRDGLWAFSFDPEAVRLDLSARVLDVADRIDPDLRAKLLSIDTRDVSTMETPLARRILAPEMPRYAVVVGAVDSSALDARRRAVRAQRTVVITLAVFAAILGLIASVRLINRELETASNKADFAANVSHELRSPITQIRLKAEALQLGLTRDDADLHAHYDAIVRQAEHLSRLVDNVLDFSAIERGVKRYTFRPEALDGVILKAFQSMEEAARSEGLRLTLQLADDLPMVHMDREAMGQVLTNLLSNAIKYGSDGDTVDVVVDQPTPDRVRIAVTDHGLGIAQEDQAKIFGYFYRVQSADVRRRRGTGIGLTIIRYIVEAHGGTIAVDSDLGVGSTFLVTVPLHPPEPPKG